LKITNNLNYVVYMGHKLNTYTYLCNWIYNLQLFGQIQILKTFYIQNKRVNIPNKLKKYLLEI